MSSRRITTTFGALAGASAGGEPPTPGWFRMSVAVGPGVAAGAIGSTVRRSLVMPVACLRGACMVFYVSWIDVNLVRASALIGGV